MLERLRPYDMPMGGTDGDPEPREVKNFLKSQILTLRAKRLTKKWEKAIYTCQDVKDRLVRMGDLLKTI